MLYHRISHKIKKYEAILISNSRSVSKKTMEKATYDKNMLVRKEENIRIIELGINERSEFFECQN